MNVAKSFLTAGLTALVFTMSPVIYAAPESGPVPAAQIEAAKTPAEHEAVAKIFEDEAASLTKKSEMHDDIAKTNGVPGGKGPQLAMAKHCAALAKDYKAAAMQNLELAAIHRKMAQEAAK